MGKSIQILALLGAMAGTQAHALSGDNPFAKTQQIHAGAGSDWAIDGDVLRKSSGDEAGTWYHLEVGKTSMRLVMSASNDISDTRSYKTLAVENMAIDGSRMPVFKWCLQNQQGHNRFLQQGQNVKMDICENRGEAGEFRVKVNNQTMQALEQGKRMSFTIKPFRSLVEVQFDIENLADAMVAMDLANGRTKAVAKAPAVTSPVAAAAAPAKVVVTQEVKMCDATAPAGFKSIKAESYVCSDSNDKIRAHNKIAIAVDREKQKRAAIAKKREQQRQAALEAKRKQEQEMLARQEKEQQEQDAIAASQLKHIAVLDELTQKMLGVCNKMWGKGQHRCYCEKYIQHAPAGIQSDPDCSS